MKFSNISSILLGCIIAQPVASQLSSSYKQLPFGVEKTCTNARTNCQLRVSISCKYRSPIDGTDKPCIDRNGNGLSPFLTIPEAECGTLSPVFFQVTYKVCNDNDVDFFPSPDHEIKFREEMVVDPSYWDFAIEANTCRLYQVNQSTHPELTEVDLCKETRVIDNEADGNLDQAFPNYCRCYLYKESKVELLTGPLPTDPPTSSPTSFPTASPTTSPTASPSSYPTASPTSYPTASPTSDPTAMPTRSPDADPTKSPTAYPTSYPTANPVAGPACDYFFTEFADPSDNPDAGYIEIKTTCPGKPVPAKLSVIVKKDPNYTVYISSHLKTFPSSGFIIICKDKTVFELNYGKYCDIESCDVQNEGIYPIKLKLGDTAIDTYGYGTYLIDMHIFPGGRAVRNFAYPVSSLFDPVMWNIIPSAGVDDMDPGKWEEDPLVLYFTEFADPSDNGNLQFIELYSPNKRNYKIREKLVIIKYDQYFNRYGTLTLTGMTINKHGFLVLCVGAWAGGKCTSVLGVGSFVHAPGTTKYALSACVTCPRIDAYGFGCSSELHDYTDGRAVRKFHVPVPFADFSMDHWIIIPGSGSGSVSSDGADPGEWKEETPPPVPAPSSSGKKPSKGKSKSKRRVLRK